MIVAMELGVVHRRCNMFRSLVKALAYTKAPRGTFALLHPRTALKYGALFWIGKKILGGGRRHAKPRQA
jgi:hypothetical protein